VISFFGEPCLKEALVRRVAEHERLDQFIQQVYWDGQRGCSIGCALHTDDHMAFERELNLPVFLAYMVEHIYERLPLTEAKFWTRRWVEATPVGVDLDLLFPRFMHWLLSDPDGMRQCANRQTLPIIDSLVSMYAARIQGIPFDIFAARSAAESARSAAESAESAAWSAARSAAESSESAAWSAAWSAESAAWSAARSAAESSESAAWSAARSAARSAAWSAARSAAIHRQADYLIALLQSYDSQPILVVAPCAEREWIGAR
jgi:hypothetical protein